MPALILQKRHAERWGDRVPSPERGHGALLGGAVGRQDEREKEGREEETGGNVSHHTRV